MIKRFVLDTNILLHSPHAMENGFEDNHVIITGTTLQELDSKKELGGEIGYNARESVRILDKLREKGDLTKGVGLENGGFLFVEPNGVDGALLPSGYHIDVPDNRILSTCLWLNKRSKLPVTLITNDVSMRVNASVLGIKVEGYRNEQIEATSYTGHTELQLPTSVINNLYSNGKAELKKSYDLMENEFVTVKSGNQSALSVHRRGTLYLIREQKTFGGVKPLNAMQSYALWALRAPAEQIPLVILIGAAGTAKTFLSLAAGLENTYVSQRGGDGDYNKILLSRPNGIGFSNVGFLPGDLNDKLSPLMASYYDNMEILLSGGKERETREQIRLQMDDILETGVVEVCSLDFIRGRSLQNTYIICDEAQNASRGLIRDVITRAGRGTKVVLAGDPGQIDVPSLDKRSNGLVYAASKMAGKSLLTALVTFDTVHSVRSELSKVAVELMNF